MRYSCYLLLRLKCAKSGSRVKMFVTEKQKFEKRAASEQAAGQSRTKSPLTSWNVRDKQREGLLVPMPGGGGGGGLWCFTLSATKAISWPSTRSSVKLYAHYKTPRRPVVTLGKYLDRKREQRNSEIYREWIQRNHIYNRAV